MEVGLGVKVNGGFAVQEAALDVVRNFILLSITHLIRNILHIPITIITHLCIPIHKVHIPLLPLPLLTAQLWKHDSDRFWDQLDHLLRALKVDGLVEEGGFLEGGVLQVVLH